MKNTAMLGVAGLVIGLAPSHVYAQVRVGVEEGSLASLHRRPAALTPRIAQPGAVVNIHAVDLPVLAPLRVGVGALRFGFEEADWVLSDDEGEFEMDVTIPDWARNDVVHVLIVFDPYFAPLALSEMLHITDHNGLVRRQGVLSDIGGRCPTLLGEDEILYVVTGSLGDLAAGDRVMVEGSIEDSAQCPGRMSIAISDIRISGV